MKRRAENCVSHRFRTGVGRTWQRRREESRDRENNSRERAVLLRMRMLAVDLVLGLALGVAGADEPPYCVAVDPIRW